MAAEFQVYVREGAIHFIPPSTPFDIVLGYSDLFRLADAIGNQALRLPKHISDPTADELATRVLRLRRYETSKVTISFAYGSQRAVAPLVWTRNEALAIAEKMAEMSDAIAGEMEKK